MSFSLRFTCVVVLLSVFAPASAQFLANPPPPPPTAFEKQIQKMTAIAPLLKLARDFESKQDWKSYGLIMQRIIVLRPFAGNMKLELAAAYAMQNDLSKTYDTLIKLQSEGYGFELNDDERFGAVKNTKVWDYLLDNFAKNAKPSGNGKVAYRLPKQDLMIESLSYDPIGKTLLAGSVRDGKIYRLLPTGKLQELIKPDARNGLWSVFDMAVDAQRSVLWVASSAVPHGKHVKAADYGRVGLFKFDLKTRKLLATYQTQAGGRQRLLSNVTVSPSGDAFVVDSVNSEILRTQGQGLVQVIRNPTLSSMRGLAFNKTGKLLYLADYEQGIFGLNLETNKAFGVAVGKGLSLYGIDGLYFYDGNLIATQNAFPPARIIRMKLSEDGTRVAGFQALDSGRVELEMPTLGVVSGDKFYSIANSQKALYDRFGILRDDKLLQPLTIFESDLGIALDAKNDTKMQVGSKK